MYYNKLVRDKIPQILDKKGVIYKKRIANDLEFKDELIKKLKEETEEFSSSESIEELADVLEVIEYLIKLDDYRNVQKVKADKKEERGGFDDKIILAGNK